MRVTDRTKFNERQNSPHQNAAIALSQNATRFWTSSRIKDCGLVDRHKLNAILFQLL